jgi:hypothetical protein
MYDSWADEATIPAEVATLHTTTVAEQLGRER